MAYASSSSPVSTTEFMNAINAFIAALNPTNWTVLESHDDDWTTGDEGNPLVIQHSNGTVDDDVFIHLWRRLSTNFGLNLATGFANDNNVTKWWGQTGARFGADADSNAKQRYCKTSHGTSTINQYHLFGYDDFFYAVFQTTTGLWRNFGFGHMTKIDDFNGGGFCCASFCTSQNDYEDSAVAGGYTQFFDQFYSGSNDITGNDHCSQIRVDNGGTLRYVIGTLVETIDNGGVTNWDRIAGANDTFGYSGNPYYATSFIGDGANEILRAPFEPMKIHNAPSSFGLTSPLIPIYHYINRGPTPPGDNILTAQRSLTSTLPNIFCLNIKDLVETQEITIQGKPYLVFPASRKTSTSGQDGTNTPNSYRYGFCIWKDDT